MTQTAIPEITDEKLAEIRSAACSPVIRSLVARLDRVEGERELEVKRYAAQCANLAKIGGDNVRSAGAAIDFLAGMVLDLSGENTALRERVKRMEEALRFYANENIWMEIEDDRGEIAQAALKEGE